MAVLSAEVQSPPEGIAVQRYARRRTRALKAFFVGEINTRSNVSADVRLHDPNLATLPSLQSLAKSASPLSTLLEIGALFAHLARGSQALVVAPRTPFARDIQKIV